MLPSGATNNEIGLALNISGNTVKEYLTRMFQKTGCRDRTGLAALYVRSAGRKRGVK